LARKVLKNGVEVKLQRNALSVLEHPTGHEEDDDRDYDNSSSGSDIGEKDNYFCKIHYVSMMLNYGFCLSFLLEDGNKVFLPLKYPF
jgi:hypothetical protein